MGRRCSQRPNKPESDNLIEKTLLVVKHRGNRIAIAVSCGFKPNLFAGQLADRHVGFRKWAILQLVTRPCDDTLSRTITDLPMRTLRPPGGIGNALASVIEWISTGACSPA